MRYRLRYAGPFRSVSAWIKFRVPVHWLDQYNCNFVLWFKLDSCNDFPLTLFVLLLQNYPTWRNFKFLAAALLMPALLIWKVEIPSLQYLLILYFASVDSLSVCKFCIPFCLILDVLVCSALMTSYCVLMVLRFWL